METPLVIKELLKTKKVYDRAFLNDDSPYKVHVLGGDMSSLKKGTFLKEAPSDYKVRERVPSRPLSLI